MTPGAIYDNADTLSRRSLLSGALTGTAALLLGACGRQTSPGATGGLAPESPAVGRSTRSGPTEPSGLPGSGPAASGEAAAPPSVIVGRSHVPVLCFHQIRDWTAGDSRSARVIITPPRRFGEQMAALARERYTSINPGQLLAYLRYGTPPPPRPVLLSFDDASAGQYTNALPVLLQHGFTAVFFIMTVVLDKPGWLSRTQVRDLNGRGMTIAAHTWDHHPVTRYSDADWRVQLVEPARELERIIDRPVRLFAYPYGMWNQAALPHVAAAGYEAAFQLAEAQDPNQPLLTIRRIMAASDWDGPTLLRQLATSF